MKIRVLLVKPRRKPEVVMIEDSLEGLQDMVGGNIRAVYPFNDPVALITNEEGKMCELTPNRALKDENGELYDIIFGDFLVLGNGKTYDVIAGDFLVVGLIEENFGSLSDELVEYLPADIVFTEKEKKTLKRYAQECGYEISIPCNYRYCYCIADRIDLAGYWESILMEINYPRFKNINMDVIKKLESYIINLFEKICEIQEAAGYQFFYEITDEEMEDVCEANDFVFLEDGSLFSE